MKLVQMNAKNESKGIHTFCATRWTMRNESCSSNFNSHNELRYLYEWSLMKVKDTKMKTKTRVD